MGETSLVGIVDLMTGEKDPRNLMMVFSILKVVMMEWDITSHVEVCALSLAFAIFTNMRSYSLTLCTITSQLPSDLRQTTPTGLLHRI
jgi:hypothetical protein